MIVSFSMGAEWKKASSRAEKSPASSISRDSSSSIRRVRERLRLAFCLLVNGKGSWDTALVMDFRKAAKESMFLFLLGLKCEIFKTTSPLHHTDRETARGILGFFAHPLPTLTPFTVHVFAVKPASMHRRRPDSNRDMADLQDVLVFFGGMLADVKNMGITP